LVHAVFIQEHSLAMLFYFLQRFLIGAIISIYLCILKEGSKTPTVRTASGPPV